MSKDAPLALYPRLTRSLLRAETGKIYGPIPDGESACIVIKGEVVNREAIPYDEARTLIYEELRSEALAQLTIERAAAIGNSFEIIDRIDGSLLGFDETVVDLPWE